MTNDVLEWYGGLYDEAGRLTDDSLEFVRCKRIIDRCLTEQPMRIADIGGASGTYSFWLAGLGHEVSLIDLTPRHIEQAKARALDTGVPLHDYSCADARQLPFEDATFDLVLVMGPLYHLQEADDRLQALREAYRVLKPGGKMACQVISRWASVGDGFKLGLVKDDYFKTIMLHDMATGQHNNPRKVDHYFTTAHFHRPDEIVDEVSQAGFEDISLIAVEGFAAPLDTDAIMADLVMAPALLDCLDATETVPELMGVSPHIMAVGQKG